VVVVQQELISASRPYKERRIFAIPEQAGACAKIMMVVALKM
jgi:hypothetical protein